jgi:tripartite-type tricarboxylate transporter receptor subunit TctC
MKHLPRLLAAMATLALACTMPAQAQPYPNKMIRVYVSSAPGSAPDIMARLIADALGKGFGQTAIVENKVGAGGIVVMSALKAAPPDGYTIGLVQAAVATVTPLTYKAATFEIERDFDTIGTVGVTPMLYTANPKSGIKTLAEAIALARSQPDTVMAGNPTRTSIPHLANALLADKSGAVLRHVPFSGTPQGIQSVLAGDIQLYTDGVTPLIPLVKGGKLNALAVAADTVLPGLEGIPLAKDTVPGLVVYGWFTLHAPKGTPRDVLQRLNTELNEALKRPEVVARLHSLGTYPRIATLDESASFVRQQKALFGGVVKSMGLQPE